MVVRVDGWMKSRLFKLTVNERARERISGLMDGSIVDGWMGG